MKRIKSSLAKPELLCENAASWYDVDACRYHAANDGHNKQQRATQAELTSTALSLLLAGYGDERDHKTLSLLDIGCGSGLSSYASLSMDCVAYVCGLDVSESMLRIACKKPLNAPYGCFDGVLSDLRHPLPLRHGSVFDAAISISALQWLLPAKNDIIDQSSVLNDCPFFHLLCSLRHRLHAPAKAVFQIYFESPAQAAFAVSASRNAGFASSRLMAHYPHSGSFYASRKLFLSLSTNDETIEDRGNGVTCPLASPYSATCPLVLPASAVILTDTCREKLRRIHVEYAHRTVRLLAYENDLREGSTAPSGKGCPQNGKRKRLKRGRGEIDGVVVMGKQDSAFGLRIIEYIGMGPRPPKSLLQERAANIISLMHGEDL